MQTSFRASLVPAALLTAFFSSVGFLALLKEDTTTVGAITATTSELDADPFDLNYEEDDPCYPPRFPRSEGGTEAPETSACPVNVSVASAAPTGICPAKRERGPCMYPPQPPPGTSDKPAQDKAIYDMLGRNANQGSGAMQNFAALPTFYDQAPVPHWINDYGSAAQSRANRLDAPSVDVRTGFLTWRETDLYLPGIGMDFTLARTYHSQLAGYNSPFGSGWEHSIHRRVFVVARDAQTGDPEEIRMVTGAGLPTGSFFHTSNGWFESTGALDLFQWTDLGSGVELFVHYETSGLTETFERKSATVPCNENTSGMTA